MNDCEHSFFDGLCCVCWWKMANKITVKGSPTYPSEWSDEEVKNACMRISMEMAQANVDAIIKQIPNWKE